MNCPKCNISKTQVLETRRECEGAAVRRTRSCSCGKTFSTYEINGDIWATVKKWAVASNAVALKKKQALRRRNAEIIQRVKQGDKRKHLAVEYGLSAPMVSTITRRAGLPRVAYRKAT